MIRLAMLAALAAILWLPAALPAQSTLNRGGRVFDLKPLSDQKVNRLEEEARQFYSMGLAALDKIDYEMALEFFQEAVEQEPENVYLRFIVVQMAYYLGETRFGEDAYIRGDSGNDDYAERYYEIAVRNLEQIAISDRLNRRERDKAEAALELMRRLRDTVRERDEARIAEGRAIAKEYAKVAYPEEDEEEGEEDGAED